MIKKKIELHGHYDIEKKATVVAEYNGYDYYLTRRQMKAAERRAGIIVGDWLESYDPEAWVIVEG